MLLRLFAALILLAAVCACSPRAFVADRVADAVARSGADSVAEDDPALVRDAAPFALKAMESLLRERAGHRGLLLALCRGFTQYAAAFVRQDALEEADPARSEAGLARARRLLLRARDYGMRGLAAASPGFLERFAERPAEALRGVSGEEVPLLYWTGVAWTLAISTGPPEPALLADLPRCEAIMRRALELREDFDSGALHEYFIAFEGGRPEAMGGSIAKARAHLERAMALSGGTRVSPLVTFAETASVRAQDRRGFLELLDRALAFDAYAGAPEHRLANLVAQRKARWLKGRVDELFVD